MRCRRFSNRPPRRAAVDQIQFQRSEPPKESMHARIRTAQRVPAGRRSAAGHRRARRRDSRKQARPGAAGGHGVGQDFHDGQRHRASAAADACAIAQQDAGRPAVCRVQGLLSQQRGHVLRQLLRLLPARGVHSAAGHLYRERRLDQRGDRSAQAAGYEGPRQASRRHGDRQRFARGSRIAERSIATTC